MLVDPELAALARELLREPDEAGGKGGYMSALGTHEISSGVSLGLEPPLSPPVVRSPMASAMPTGDGLAGLPTPPPAIRPPESATPPPAPAVHAEVPQQPEPAPAPAPVQPEPVLPAVAPAQEPEAPVLDYFAAETAAAPEPAAAPAPAPADEPVQAVELNTIPLVAPAPAPAEETKLEPVVLPTMSPSAPVPEPQPEPELAPAAVVAPVELPMMAPQQLETVAPAPEPEPAVAPEPVAPSLPELEPAAFIETAPSPEPAPELEELFAPVQQQRQSGFSVVVRLRDGDGVEVGSFRDFGTAMGGAQEVIEQFSTATDGQWPFYAGRFIRPDLIVSVDVVEANADAI
jgi:hypothetical protein